MTRLFGKLMVLVLAFGLMVSIASAADITTALMGYWPLDGDANDHSDKGFNGKAVGVQWVAGHVGKAAKISGVGQYIDVTGFSLKTDKITFVAWINGSPNHTWAGIIMSRGTNNNGIGYGDGGALHYTWSGDTTWEWHGGPVIPKDTWCMVAAALDPAQATAYLYTNAGGLKSAVNKAAHPAETVDKVKFGWDECCDAGARWFNGMIDEVAIYNRTLTQDDIQTLATKGLAGAAVESVGKLSVTWGEMKK